MMTDQLMWRTVLAVTLSLGMLPTWSWAAVPVVTDVEVSPSILTQGSGVQPVTVTVRAFDTDGDLKNVKVIARFKDGTKTKVALVDNGLGQFTGVVELDTATAQRVGLEIKAKDEAKQKVKRGAIVTVVDTAAVPTLSDVVIASAVLEAGSGLQFVTVSVQVVDPDGDLKNVKLEQLAKPGQGRPRREVRQTAG